MKYWHPHLPFGQHISVSTLVYILKYISITYILNIILLIFLLFVHIAMLFYAQICFISKGLPVEDINLYYLLMSRYSWKTAKVGAKHQQSICYHPDNYGLFCWIPLQHIFHLWELNSIYQILTLRPSFTL